MRLLRALALVLLLALPAHALEYHIIPYAATGAGWWASADIYNGGKDPADVWVQLQRDNGSIAKNMTAKIAPRQHHIVRPADLGPEIKTIIISGPDGLLVTAFQGNAGMVTTLPVNVESNLGN